MGVLSFFKLVHNENIKSISKKGTFVMIGIILIWILMNFALMKPVPQIYRAIFSDWKSGTQEKIDLKNKQIEKDEKTLKNYKKNSDEYKSSIENIKESKQKVKYLENTLAKNIPGTDVVTPLGFALKNIGIGVVVILLFIIAVTCIGNEYSMNTIKYLLARPHGRIKILMSKYVSIIFIGIIFMLIQFVLSLIIGFIISPEHIKYTSQLIIDGNGVQQINVLEKIAETFSLKTLELIFYTTIAFSMAVLTKSNAIAMTISMVIYFGSGIVSGLISNYEWAKYLFNYHFDLTQYLKGNSLLLPDNVPSESIMICMAYMLVFLTLSAIFFKKRDVF